MNDDETLEVLARIAILEGRLPRRIQRIWAGSGEGIGCTLCGDHVHRGEPGYEFPGEDDPAHSTCVLHFRCFAAWNAARERLERHTPGRVSEPRALLGGVVTNP